MTTTTRREVLLYGPRYAPATSVSPGDSVAIGHDVAGLVHARADRDGLVVLRIHTREGSHATVELAPTATVFVWHDPETPHA